MTFDLSVVIPVLNEAACIEHTLRTLAPSRARGVEIIVVDGGSCDGTQALAASFADRVIAAPRGRAPQLNAGAQAARGRVLMFLHADSVPPSDFDEIIQAAVGTRHRAWGRFDVLIEGKSRGLVIVGAMMNLRSRLTGIATGDQGIFATRELFAMLEGFPAQPLMEDIEFSKRAKRLARPICVTARMQTSGRRWDRHGLLRTTLSMWRLRLSYFFGTDPVELQRRYADTR